MTRQIAVDCDLVVCPSDEGWIEYLEYYNGFGAKVQFDQLPYDLSKVYPNVNDPMQYWRTLDYFQFWPIAGSVKALEQLSQYFGIVFVSRTKGSHSKSKYYWLNEHFPFRTEYVVVHNKGVLEKAFECMIDDRLSVLQGFPQHKRVLFETPYSQDVDCGVQYSFSEWNEDVVKKICELYLK